MDKQKVLAKVAKLLALANSSGASPTEVETAFRQARALAAKYNLELAEVQASQVAEASVPTKTRRSPADWQHALALACAQAFDCIHLSYYLSGQGYCFKFLGKGIGPELSSYAYSSLHHQLQKARRAHVSQLTRCQLRTKRRRGQLFAEGWIQSILQKVRQLAPSMDATTDADIKAYLTVHHPELKYTNIEQSEAKGYDRSSLHAGREQGKKARLHRGVGQDRQAAIAHGGVR